MLSQSVARAHQSLLLLAAARYSITHRPNAPRKTSTTKTPTATKTNSKGKGKGKGKGKAVEEVYTKLTQREHVLLRPDTYIGSVERQRGPAWRVVDGEDGTVRMERAELDYVPGLGQTVDELLVNASDNAARDEAMRQLRIWADPQSNSFSVYNDGAGIPVIKHAKEGIYIPQMVFGSLLSGSNFDDSVAKVTGGRNGYGAKLANIFASSFSVTTRDAHALYSQRWTANMTSVSDPLIVALDKGALATAADARKLLADSDVLSVHPELANLPAAALAAPSFTYVSYTPDLTKFDGMADGIAGDDVLHFVRRRAFDLAAVLGPRTRVYHNGTRVPVSDFSQYMELFGEQAPPAAAESNAAPPPEVVTFSPHPRWSIGITLAPPGSGFAHASFVNAIATSRGGRHVDYAVDQVVKAMVSVLSKDYPSAALTPAVIKSSLMLFVDASIANPTFDSQTKEFLTTKVREFGSSFKVTPAAMRKVLAKAPVLTEAIVSRAASKSASSLARKMSGTKKRRITGIPKLEDATKAGTSKSADTTLILTEGDSAKALAVAGLAVVGRDDYGVFPLRGKVLNVRDATQKAVTNNAELSHIITILGLKVGADYSKPAALASLRYGRVMLMTDQDVDGSHIKGLFLNFLHFFFPDLLASPGFVVQFITPLVKAKYVGPAKAAPESREHAFYTLPEFEAFKAQVGPALSSQWSVKYYKGLGTSSASEARAYFGALDRHIVPFVADTPSADELLDMAFRKARAADRKAWLSNSSATDMAALQAPLYTPGSGLSIDDFINRELIQFSLADNVRSIPSAIDGLKPGQRKVLFAARRRRLWSSELKVAQLAGYVSETTGYHHGEASLASTIIAMAQDYVGANNINLLAPLGQFGTRLQGGKDAASPRYIYTRLSPLTQALLPLDDDPVLARAVDDSGDPVEPVVYLPVIPLLLVNGAEGIGTGWSSSIPKYNPLDVLAAVRARVLGKPESAAPLVPWARGFTGSFDRASSKKFIVSGTVTRSTDDPTRAVVSELPLGMWTQSYKEWLEAQVLASEANTAAAAKALVSAYTEGHSDVDVSFTLTLTQTAAELDDAELAAKLKLSSSLSLNNMHAFGGDGKIARFASPEAILDEFYPARLEGYVRRKSHILAALTADIHRLALQVAFIEAVANGSLDLTAARDLSPDAVAQSVAAHASVSVDSIDDDAVAKLLALPLSSLTAARRKSLAARLDTLTRDHAALEASSPEDLWLADLDTLEAALKDATPQ